MKSAKSLVVEASSWVTRHAQEFAPGNQTSLFGRIVPLYRLTDTKHADWQIGHEIHLLKPDARKVAFLSVTKLKDKSVRARAYSLMLPYLPPDLREKSVRGALEALQTEKNDWTRWLVLRNLGGFISDREGEATVAAAMKITEQWMRDEVLFSFFSFVSDETQKSLFEQLRREPVASHLYRLDIILNDVRPPLDVLATDLAENSLDILIGDSLLFAADCAPRLLTKFRPDKLPALLSEIWMLPPENRMFALLPVSPYLPRSAQAEARQIVKAFNDRWLLEAYGRVLGCALRAEFSLAPRGHDPVGLLSYEALEGFAAAEAEANDIVGLPSSPPKLWPGRARGRPRAEPQTTSLVDFIREVYGPYFRRHRKALRAYIFQNDFKLYRAIQEYERGGRKLPSDIAMPSERERMRQMVQKAGRLGFDRLLKPERRSISRKVARHKRPGD